MSAEDPLETPYSTSGEADIAVANFFGGGEETTETEDDGDLTDTYGASAIFTGTLDVGTLAQGGAADVTATVSNDGTSEQAGTFGLAVTDGQGGAYRLDSVQASVGAGETITAEFAIPRGALGNPPGQYTMAVLAQTPAGSGVVVQKTVTVTGPNGEGGEGEDGQGDPDWGDVYFLQELDFGWNLYGQDHTSEERTRYIVSAKNSEGSVIYLNGSGGITASVFFFDTLEAVAQALARFAQRMDGGEYDDGEMPDPSQPRPTVEELQQAVIEDSGLLGGGGLFGTGIGVIDGGVILALVAVVAMNQTGRLSDKNSMYAAGVLGGALVLRRVGGVF